MSYSRNRGLGYRPWGVVNPFVYANYGQPQRRRGYVSPMVMQTSPPFLKTVHLGQTQPMDQLLERSATDLERGERMEKYALAGLALSGLSLAMAYRFYSSRMKT